MPLCSPTVCPRFGLFTSSGSAIGGGLFGRDLFGCDTTVFNDAKSGCEGGLGVNPAPAGLAGAAKAAAVAMAVRPIIWIFGADIFRGQGRGRARAVAAIGPAGNFWIHAAAGLASCFLVPIMIPAAKARSPNGISRMGHPAQAANQGLEP